MSEAPDWASLLKPGRWYGISGDRPDLGLPPTRKGTRYLADNDPARDASLNPPRSRKEQLRRMLGRDWLSPWHGRMGFPSITEAWNGAAYASGFGMSGSIVVFGGGHNDYFGSDVHSFDIASREWTRLADGYVTGQPHEYGKGARYSTSVYPDGSPLPPHTYDYVQYDDQQNSYLLLKGQVELGPHVKATAIPHMFDLDTRAWRHGPRYADAVLNSGGFTTWDPQRRILWGHSGDDGGGNAFVGFSPDGRNADGTHGSWQAFHPNKFPGEANHNAMQYHPALDLIIVALHRRDGLASIDPDRPGDPARAIESRGARPRIREFGSLEYAPGTGQLVYYSAAGGADVYGIAIRKAARWEKLTRDPGLNPVKDAVSRSRFAVNPGHTFGRFRVLHFEQFDMAILVRHIDTPVYVMRLG